MSAMGAKRPIMHQERLRVWASDAKGYLASLDTTHRGTIRHRYVTTQHEHGLVTDNLQPSGQVDLNITRVFLK